MNENIFQTPSPFIWTPHLLIAYPLFIYIFPLLFGTGEYLKPLLYFLLMKSLVIRQKGRISNRRWQENKARKIFQKNEHFSPTNAHTCLITNKTFIWAEILQTFNGLIKIIFLESNSYITNMVRQQKFLTQLVKDVEESSANVSNYLAFKKKQPFTRVYRIDCS